jgi:hypothetical protein
VRPIGEESPPKDDDDNQWNPERLKGNEESIWARDIQIEQIETS